MQHPMLDRPGLHLSYAGRSGIGIDGNQLYLAGGPGFQPSPGSIYNLSSQWTNVLASRVDESENHLATTQGRKCDGVTELVGELEVRCGIACHEKAATCLVRCTGSRLRGCLGAMCYESLDRPAHDHKYHYGNKGSSRQYLHIIWMPHGSFLSPNRGLHAFTSCCFTSIHHYRRMKGVK